MWSESFASLQLVDPEAAHLLHCGWGLAQPGLDRLNRFCCQSALQASGSLFAVAYLYCQADKRRRELRRGWSGKRWTGVKGQKWRNKMINMLRKRIEPLTTNKYDVQQPNAKAISCYPLPQSCIHKQTYSLSWSMNLYMNTNLLHFISITAFSCGW